MAEGFDHKMHGVGTSRVLIVEDDMATMFAMTRLFATQGWEVSRSKTVAGALAQLDPSPDWIVLDMGLANGAGADVLRQVRHAGLTSRVAIVSTVLDSERLESLGSLEPDVVFPKPLRFADLLEVCTGGAECR